MKLKLKKCVNDEDFLHYGITNRSDDFKKIRNGIYTFEECDDPNAYFIKLKGNHHYWYVKKHWFITVKE